MYLFIDIDGVFVREDQPGKAMNVITDENDVPVFEPDCIQPFTQVISGYEQIKIVISSSWREIFDLNIIKSRFPECIREKIVGMTPSIWSFVSEGELPQYVRHQEVLKYLQIVNANDAYWIAIDDIPEHYPPDVAIVVTNPYIGFDDAAAMKLVNLIN